MEGANEPKPRVIFEFQVEKIIDVSSNGEYKVQWAPTWVSKFHLDGCEHLIQQFLQQQTHEIKVEEFLQQQTHEIKVEARFSDTEVTSEMNNDSDNRCVELPVVAEAEYRQTISNQPLLLSENHGVLGGNETTGSTNGSTSLSLLHRISDIHHDKQELVFQNTDSSVLSNKDKEATERNSFSESEFGSTRPGDWQYSDSQTDREEVDTRLQNTLKEFPVPNDIRQKRHGKYECDYCNKKFETKSNLTRHIRIHTNEKPFSCDYCPYSCNQKTTLIQHIRIHTGERPYICDVCKKSFSHKGGLNCHKRIHSGEKPYSCYTCGKSFTWKKTLNRHDCTQR